MPENKFADCKDRKEVLFQAMGAASMCWEDVTKAGIFQSEEAAAFCEEAYTRLNEIDGPLLGLATTEHLLQEIKARMSFADDEPYAVALGINCQMALEMMAAKTLAYRTIDS